MTATEQAVNSLRNAGFTANGISVLLPENLGSREIGTEKTSKAPEGATAGLAPARYWAAVWGLPAGIGTLAIPGVGPLIAAGPIMATLAGMGVGGTVGGLAGALIGAGIPEFASVHCPTSEQLDRAKPIFKAAAAKTSPQPAKRTFQRISAPANARQADHSQICK